MNIIKACIIAVSMYSKIPMPQFEWEEKSMRYALAFLPLPGFIIGVLQLVLFYLWQQSGLSVGIYAALATALPIAVTGGIHMDGYCDTIDALSSHQSKERRLEILKDANVGAFAVIWAVLYFVLYYGAWSSIASKAMQTDSVMPINQALHANTTVWLIAAGYVTSRALSGLFPKCKQKRLTCRIFRFGRQRICVYCADSCIDGSRYFSGNPIATNWRSNPRRRAAFLFLLSPYVQELLWRHHR